MTTRKDFETEPVEYMTIDTPHGPVKVVAKVDYFYNGRRYFRTFKYNSMAQRISGGGDFPA